MLPKQLCTGAICGVRQSDGPGFQPLCRVRVFFLGFHPRLVLNAPLALEFDGPKAQRHSSLGHRPRFKSHISCRAESPSHGSALPVHSCTPHEVGVPGFMNTLTRD